MSETRMAEIRARLEAATPGPWKANLYLGGAYAIDRVAPNGDRLARVAVVDGMIQTPANAALIAHAPADLAYLLDTAARLTRELEEARERERGLRVALVQAAATIQESLHVGGDDAEA